MTIRLRLIGGFALSLCLTTAVAVVGWRSLDGFSQRVEIVTTAQTLGAEAGALDNAAEKAMRDTAGTAGNVANALAKVRETTGALAKLPGTDAGTIAAAHSMDESLAAFEQSFGAFRSEQETKAKLQGTHRALVDEFQGTVDSIADTQQASLTATNKSVESLLAEQGALDSASRAGSFAMRSVYELRGVEPAFVQSGDAEPLAKAKTLTNTIGLLLKRVAANPRLKDAVQQSVEATERYRAALAAAETASEKRADLAELSATLLKSLQSLETAESNAGSSLRAMLNDAQVRLRIGTELLGLSARAVAAAKSAQAEELQLFISGSAEAAKALEAATEHLQATTKAISYQSLSDASRQTVEGLLVKIDEYKASIPQIIQANAAQARLLAGLAENLRAVIDQAHAIAEGQLARMAGERRNALLFLAGGLALAIVSGLLMALLISRSIVRPLTTLGGAMDRMAQGDFLVDLSEAGRRDELGDMAKAVVVFREAGIEKQRLETEAVEQRRLADEGRRLAEEERARNQVAAAAAAETQATVVHALATGLEKLSSGDLAFRLEQAFAPEYEKLRTDFNAAMERLRETMRTVFGSTTGIRSGTGEISQAADDLSRRTEHQATSLEQTAAALDQITSTVKRTAEGAAHAHDIVVAARTTAEQSGEVMHSAVKAMGEIEKSAAGIAQIIGLIDEIAFQTNLLALNASVEAARAGDSGRGFAVVASEVRALAQRSTDAAKDIKALISTSNAQVADGVALVGRTGEALGRIVAGISEISEIVSGIAASAKEQAAGLTEVNNAVNQMDTVTQQNAAMVEESTAACHTLAREADDLAGMIARFRLEARGDAAQNAVAPRGRHLAAA